MLSVIYAELRWVSFMLSVIVLNAIMLNVVAAIFDLQILL